MRQGEGQKLWKARKRAEWLAQGLCQRCGKNPITKGTTCDDCRNTIAANTKAYRLRAKARLRMQKLRADRRKSGHSASGSPSAKGGSPSKATPSPASAGHAGKKKPT